MAGKSRKSIDPALEQARKALAQKLAQKSKVRGQPGFAGHPLLALTVVRRHEGVHLVDVGLPLCLIRSRRTSGKVSLDPVRWRDAACIPAAECRRRDVADHHGGAIADYRAT